MTTLAAERSGAMASEMPRVGLSLVKTADISQQEIQNMFEKLPRLFFITIKAPPGHKLQKIGPINDMIRKTASNYFIVREPNKRIEGYHYHALISLNKESIDKKWFKKGVHIHVKPFAGKCNFPSSVEEALHKKYDVDCGEDFEKLDRIDLLVGQNTARISAQVAAKRGKIKKKWKIANTLNYMFKELTEPEKYKNYICK